MMHDPIADWLFHPLPADSFLADFWAKEHHVIRRDDPGYFADLFSAKALEEFLEYGRPDPAGVRMVKGKEKKDLQSYRLGNGAIDMVALRNDFAAGFTIILNGLERYVGAVAALARGLEVELNFETQVNAYITPPGSQGFLPHYDDHDVVVLQIQGSKRWHIYEQEGDVPASELQQREIFVGEGLSPATQLKLTAGDVLYVPRGRIHAAETLDETSIHLTLGIHPPNMLELVKAALDTMVIRDDRMLERLPPRYLNDPAQRARLAELARDLVASIDDRAIGDAVGTIEDSLLRRGRCPPAGRLVADVTGSGAITQASRLGRNQPLYARVLALGGGVGLQFAQTLVTADASHRDAMLFLSRQRDPFQVAEIPGISAEERTELARKLLVDGFLVQMPV
jgi:ribosomal protein L16 Arg81 hydroxylase